MRGIEKEQSGNVHLILCICILWYGSHPLLLWCPKLQNICWISTNKPLGPGAHVSRLQTQTANTTIHTIIVT